MSRLLSSLTAAAAALADQAADRLDTWVENTTSTDQAPRETPLGFTVPTPAAPDTETINIVNQTWQELADHHRDRRIAADQELHVMKVRERDVEYVLDHVVDGRLKLDEYIDPETPAGRVAELVTTLLTQIRDTENGDQVQHLTDDLDAARETIADLARKLDRHHRHEGATDADAVRARAADRILAYAADEKPRVNDTYGQVYLSGLETAAALIVDKETESEPIVDVESPFVPAAQARAEAHLIKVALNHIEAGHDPRGVLHFQECPLARRVVDTIMNARADAHHRHDERIESDLTAVAGLKNLIINYGFVEGETSEALEPGGTWWQVIGHALEELRGHRNARATTDAVNGPDTEATDER
jgi:hypothetical protein